MDDGSCAVAGFGGEGVALGDANTCIRSVVNTNGVIDFNSVPCTNNYYTFCQQLDCTSSERRTECFEVLYICLINQNFMQLTLMAAGAPGPTSECAA